MSGVFIGWIVLSILVGLVASGHNRNGFAFFILSVLLSPLVSLIVLLSIGSKETAPKESHNNEVNNNDRRTCPYCAELIQKKAIYCKHCKKDLETSTASFIASQDVSIHRELQSAIYDKDVRKVKLLLSNGISETENPLAFTHLEYAMEYGNEEIQVLIKNSID